MTLVNNIFSKNFFSEVGVGRRATSLEIALSTRLGDRVGRRGRRGC